MNKDRLMELAGVQLNEENNTQIALKLSTSDLVDVVAEHMWHDFFTDGDVEQFFDDVKRDLETKRERTK